MKRPVQIAIGVVLFALVVVGELDIVVGNSHYNGPAEFFGGQLVYLVLAAIGFGLLFRFKARSPES